MASSFQSRLGTTPGEGVKAPCVVATTTNITLSGEQTIGSTDVVAGDRVLVRAQTSSAENGIYVCAASTWSRATDWDSDSDVANGVLVLETANGRAYRSSYTGTFVLGTTAVSFIEGGFDNASGITYTPAGTGAVDTDVQSKLREFVSIKDFGAVGDGVTDDTDAFENALNSGSPLTAAPGMVIRLTRTITLPEADVDLDLNGATLKSEVSSGRAFERAGGATATLTVSSQAWGSNIVTTSASPSAIPDGAWIGLGTDTNSGLFPLSYRRVESKAGNDITVDSDYDFTYPGTVTLYYYNFRNKFILKNGIIDGSSHTSTSLFAYIALYESVHIEDIQVKDLTLGTAGGEYILYINGALDVVCRNVRFEDCKCNEQALGVTSSRNAVIDSCRFNGDAFAFGFEKVDDPTIHSCKARGQHFSGGTESTRGIKFKSCFKGSASNNTIMGFVSGIREENCQGIIADSNNVHLCEKPIEFLDQVVDTDWYHSAVITNNRIHRAQNTAINCGKRHAVIGHNQIYDCQREAINFSGQGSTVQGNVVQEWDLDGVGSLGIVGNVVNTIPAIFAQNTLRTADPAKNAFRLGVGSTNVKVWDNNSNTTSTWSAPTEIPDGLDVIRDSYMKMVSVNLRIRNNAGTIEHATLSAASYTAAAYHTTWVTGASSSFAATPAGTDASTAFASGWKISSAATNRMIADVASAQSAGLTVPPVLIAVVQFNSTSTTVYVRHYFDSLDVNGTTLSRLILDFRKEDGTVFNINSTNITTGQELMVNILGFLY